MIYSFWTVVDGVLSTALINSDGRRCCIEKATIHPALAKRTPNFIDTLETGADYTGLGLMLNRLIGAINLEDLSVQAIPAHLHLFPQGVTRQPTFTPTLTVAIERWPTGELINAAALATLNQQLDSNQVIRSLGDESGSRLPALLPLQDAALPETLEVVVATKATYSHNGATFLVQKNPGVLGLHRRSVDAIETALAEPGATEGLTLYKRVSHCKRCFRDEVVKRLALLRELVTREGRTRKGLQELLDWFETEGQPSTKPGIRAELSGLEHYVRSCPLPGIQSEFAPFHDAFLETIRGQVAAQWIEFTTCSRLAQ